MKAKIYHNPRCSKSRATLALLEAHEPGLDIEVIDYLNNPLQEQEIKELLRMLGIEASALLRTGEAAFKASGLSTESPAAQLIRLMHDEPIVIERPIVVVSGLARIGRPPERVLELID